MLNICQKYEFIFIIMSVSSPKKLKDQIHDAQNRSSGEMANRISDIYNSFMMMHVCHIYQIAYRTAMDTICSHPLSHHALSHWKYMLGCCSKVPCIAIPSHESDKYHSKTCPTNTFSCIKNGILMWISWPNYTRQKHLCCVIQCHKLQQNTKLYTRKEIFMMKKSISDFNTSFYIQEIEKYYFMCHMYAF